jgi:peptidoglycan/LPS O-acetylase OafA/YrhL
MAAKSDSSRQIDALTGVRGFAALWVAAFHGSGTLFANPRLPVALANFIHGGWLAVDLFFVLSGFVISYAHLDEFAAPSVARIGRFLKLRIARIYPAHLVVALLWVPIVAAAWLSGRSLSGGLAQSFNLCTFLYAVTLTNGWGLPLSQGWNLPTWSVGSEWFAYLSFPLLAWRLQKVPAAASQIACAAITLLFTTGLALFVNHGSQYMLPQSFTLVRVVSEFFIGCCAYGVFRRRRSTWRVAWIPWTGILGSLALACSGRHGLVDGLFILLFGLVVLGLGVTTAGILVRSLACAPAVHLGKISYSIYLVHGMVIVVLREVPGLLTGWGGAHPLLLWPIYLLAVVIAGHMLYRSVEEPARRYLRARWVDRSATG